MAAGASEEHAEYVADAITFAHKQGKLNQGLGVYEAIDIALDMGLLDIEATPTVVDQGSTWATVDGCRSSGYFTLNVMADLAILFPSPPFRVTTRTVGDPHTLIREESPATQLIFPPRLWSSLSSAERSSPRVHQLRYVFEPADLEHVGRALGWSDAHRAALAAGIT